MTAPGTVMSPTPDEHLQPQIDRRFAALREILSLQISNLKEHGKLADDGLQKHIECEIRQIKLALDSSELLELSRIKAVCEQIESLRQLLQEKDKAATTADARHRESLAKADLQLSERLEHMNEFRAQIQGERATYMTRELHQQAMAQLSQIMDRNREDISKRLLRESYDTTVGEWSIWRGEINKWRDEQAGRGDGITSTVKVVMGAIMSISMVMSITAIIVAWGNSPHDAELRSQRNEVQLHELKK